MKRKNLLSLPVSALALAISACSDPVIQQETASGNESAIKDPSGWELVWSDEFEGTELDKTRWIHESNCWGGGNEELQCYVDAAANSYVKAGKLHIVAIKEPVVGVSSIPGQPEYDENHTVEREYSSARLLTRGQGDWKYGRIEVNAKMPYGQGTWPAIWMLPTENVYGGWPLSGEIDIFEAVNLSTLHTEGELVGQVNNELHGTLHYGAPWPAHRYSGKEYTPSELLWETFNTYAIEWEQDEIRWYFNDVHFATQTSAGWFTGADATLEDKKNSLKGDAPFDQKFHLILNVAVGGLWPKSPDANTTFPQHMVVDYVRVYQCSADPETGKGCATNVNPAITPLTGYPAP